MKIRYCLVALLAAVSLLGGAGAASAAAAAPSGPSAATIDTGKPNDYLALYYNPRNDLTGVGVAPQLWKARQRAAAHCGGCQSVGWVRHGYLAVATHPIPGSRVNASYAWGGGWGWSASVARRYAVRTCRLYDTGHHPGSCSWRYTFNHGVGKGNPEGGS